MKKIILLRSGESVWKGEDRYSGWADVELSERGVREAREAGQWLKRERYLFDRAYSSYLRRAICTLHWVLDAMDQEWIPVEKSWRLNEKHCGALQGLDKSEAEARFGAQQLQRWQRSYSAAPEPLSEDDSHCPWYDRRYEGIPMSDLPRAESLKDTVRRIEPYWKRQIIPSLYGVECVLVVAHGNSLRAIVRELKHLNDDETVRLNIPSGIPYVFEFDRHLRPVKDYYVGDPDQIGARMAAAAGIRANDASAQATFYSDSTASFSTVGTHDV